MAYIDQAELQSRFGADEVLALADRDHDGAPDPGVIDQAIQDASAEIDAYLGTRYNVPLSSAPAAVKTLAADITRYRLMDDRPLDEAAKRYDAAIRFLRDVANGRAVIGGIDQATEPAAVKYAAQRSQRERTFTRESLEGF